MFSLVCDGYIIDGVYVAIQWINFILIYNLWVKLRQLLFLKKIITLSRKVDPYIASYYFHKYVTLFRSTLLLLLADVLIS